jgi:hypothetical protein
VAQSAAALRGERSDEPAPVLTAQEPAS